MKRAEILFVAILVCIPVGGCNFFDSDLVRACETELKDRLKAPSSYRRVEMLENQDRQLTHDEFFEEEAKHVDAYVEDEWNRNKPLPKRFDVRITYDSQNSFGALIRNYAKCEYVAKFGSTSKPSVMDVRIDGYSKIDLVFKDEVDAARAARRRVPPIGQR
jgi:hypothetical protein